MLRLGGVLLALAFAVGLSAEPIAEGKYKGKWEGSSGASGDFTVMIAKGSGGALTPEVSFGLQGQDVKCKVVSFKVDGDKLHIVYSFDLQGNVLESTIDGSLKGKKLAGTYKTRAPGDGSAVDEGSWEANAN